MFLLTDIDLNSSPLYTNDTQHEVFTQTILPLCGRYKEILWFADDGVASTKETSSGNQSLGWTHGLASIKNTAGQPLIVLPKEKGKYVELERTLSSIVFLHWFNDGSKASYQKLTSLQKENEKLSWESYLEIHHLIKKVAPTETLLTALEAMLVFSDAGKTPVAMKKAEAQGLRKTDHDDFIAALFHLKLETLYEVLPTFKNLTNEQQQLLISASSAMPVHLGHVLHLEGGSRMFDQFKQTVLNKQVTEQLLDFAFIVQLCDVAAGLAQINNQGSLSLTENTYRGYDLVKKTLLTIVKGSDQETALKYYLNKRAEGLGVNIESPRDAFLVRLACWLRLYTPEEYRLLQNAATQLLLSSNGKSALQVAEQQFDLMAGFNLWKRNPTYGTTVLINLANFQKPDENKQLKLNRAVEGACSMAEWSDNYNLVVKHSNNPVNFNEMAGIAAKYPNLFSIESFKASDFVPNDKNVILFQGRLPSSQLLEKSAPPLTWDKNRSDAASPNLIVTNSIDNTITPDGKLHGFSQNQGN